MIRFSFRKGLRFFERQRIWTLLRRLVNQKFQLEDEQGEVMTLSQSEILTRWEKRELIVDEESISRTENAFYLATPRDLSSYREDLRAAATRRQYYLTKLGDQLKMSVAEQLRPHIKRIAAELGDANAPSPITIYRWWRAYHNTKSVSRLIDGANALADRASQAQTHSSKRRWLKFISTRKNIRRLLFMTKCASTSESQISKPTKTCKSHVLHEQPSIDALPPLNKTWLIRPDLGSAPPKENTGR